MKKQKEQKEQHPILNQVLAAENTRLIVIKPRLEDWILKCLAQSKIKPESYSLPANSHDLHKIINSRLHQFENLVKELVNAENQGMLHLKKIIDKRS